MALHPNKGHLPSACSGSPLQAFFAYAGCSAVARMNIPLIAFADSSCAVKSRCA